MKPEPDIKNELGIVAHDIRNRLAVILSASQVLEMTMADPGMEKQRRVASSIGEAARQIDTIIRDRLDPITASDSHV